MLIPAIQDPTKLKKDGSNADSNINIGDYSINMSQSFPTTSYANIADGTVLSVHGDGDKFDFEDDLVPDYVPAGSLTAEKYYIKFTSGNLKNQVREITNAANEGSWSGPAIIPDVAGDTFVVLKKGYFFELDINDPDDIGAMLTDGSNAVDIFFEHVEFHALGNTGDSGLQGLGGYGAGILVENGYDGDEVGGGAGGSITIESGVGGTGAVAGAPGAVIIRSGASQYGVDSQKIRIYEHAGIGASLLGIWLQEEGGSVYLANNGGLVAWGASQDAAIWYDGNHLHIDTQQVGDGNLILDNLPTTNPAVAGAVYSDSGTLKISPG